MNRRYMNRRYMSRRYMSRRNGSAIKGILFDMDGTLYHQVPLRILMIFLLLIKNIHHPFLLIKKMTVIQNFRKSQELLRTNNDRSGNSYQNQIRLTSERTGESQEFISQTIVEWFEKQPLKYLKLCRRKRLENMLSSLQKQGYHLGVYSDYPANDKLHALGLGNYFTTIVSSSDPDVTGVKPHTNGFHVAAQRMGSATEEIVYVGNRPEVDGKGAVASGMKYLNISKNIEQELTRLIER